MSDVINISRYTEVLSIAVRDSIIYDISYGQLEDRISELEYFDSLVDDNYSIYFNSKTKSIELDDNNELFRGSTIMFEIKDNEKQIIGPSGEYIHHISAYSLHTITLFQIAHLEIELNKNPFYIDHSGNNINDGYGNGSNSGILSYIILLKLKNELNTFYQIISSLIDTEEEISLLYTDFSNNYDISYQVHNENPRPNENTLKNIFAIELFFLFLSLGMDTEDKQIKVQILSYIGVMKLVKKFENFNTNEVTNGITFILDDDVYIISIENIRNIVQWSTISEDEQDIINNNVFLIFGLLLDSEPKRILSLVNEYNIHYDNKNYHIFPYNLLNLNKDKELRKRINISLDTILNNTGIGINDILNTNHLDKLKTFLLDFSNNTINMKNYENQKIR